MCSIPGSWVFTHPSTNSHRPTSVSKSWGDAERWQTCHILSHPSNCPILTLLRKLQAMDCVCCVVIAVMLCSMLQTEPLCSTWALLQGSTELGIAYESLAHRPTVHQYKASLWRRARQDWGDYWQLKETCPFLAPIHTGVENRRVIVSLLMT